MQRSAMSAFAVRVLALPALLVVACNALTGVGDLGVQDAISTTAGGDASTDAIAGDGGAFDTGAPPEGDGSVIVTDDAGVDATAGGDADASPPLGFCAALAPAAALCTDFDDGVFPGPWTPNVTGAATAGLVTTTFRSSPRAVQLGSPGGTSGTAFLTRTFASVANSEIVLSFALRAAQQRPVENELAVVFLASSGGNPYQVQFELLDNGLLNFEEEAPNADGTVTEKNEALGVNLTVGQWTRVTITIGIGASTSNVTFDVEGSAPVTKTALAHNYKAAPRVVIGHDSSTTSAYAMSYDDIFVRIK